jgi:DNA-binding transcriptional regulator LsrR (DeoR family)
MAMKSTQTTEEDSMAVRAAWLHYRGGLTQAAVAERLGVPSVKAHRLIARAVAEGMVKFTIDGEIIECVELENELRTRFALDICEVAPDLEEEGQPFRALGLAGASFLKRQIETGKHQLIGLGHGRTLAMAVNLLPRLNVDGLRFVSLMGSVTPDYSINPDDVMHTIAERTGALAHIMPVPFFANTVEDREVLLAQRGVREILEMANKSSLKLVGLGTLETSAQLVTSRMVETREFRTIQEAGGVGEMLGYFFDKHGRVLQTALTARTLSVSFAAPGTDRLVAIAGGAEKHKAIQAVLQSRKVNGLITDERTARALLKMQ